MRKRSLILPLLGAVVALLSVLSLFPLTASATQTSGMLISGVVTLNGQSLSPQDDATVIAMIPGVSDEWSRPVTFIPGVSRYVQLMIPMNSGSGPKNGGENGDIINFRVIINGDTYLDNTTETWMRATQIMHNINLTSAQLTGLAITTNSLASGMVGVDYSQPLTATGGTLPYHWSWQAAGSAGLPPGLDLVSDGVTAISGKPGASGNFTLTIIVEDALHVTASKNFTLEITNTPDGLMITTEELPRWPTEVPGDWVLPPPGWVVDVPYSANLTAEGGWGAYHWSASYMVGSTDSVVPAVGTTGLPSGLTLSDDGKISGTPDTPGLFKITFTVIDSAEPFHSNFKALYLMIYVRGDANGNGECSIGDIPYVGKAIIHLLAPTAGCDANLDGRIDAADITEIELINLQ